MWNFVVVVVVVVLYLLLFLLQLCVLSFEFLACGFLLLFVVVVVL
jgi:hypothetical protein